MEKQILISIIFTVVLALVLSTITVIRVLKNPEKFEKESEGAYQKLNEMKTSFMGSSLSWEEAKKQAAAELELEKQMKEQKRAEKKKKHER